MIVNTIANLLTGRLWLTDTTSGKDLRRATIGDVIACRGKRGPYGIDGRWCGFRMVPHVGFDLVNGGWAHDTLAKLIGVKAWTKGE